MAITRAQQAKQMLQNGGMLVQPGFGGVRQGYRGDDAAKSDAASGRSAGRSGPSGVDRSAVGPGSQFSRNVARQNIDKMRSELQKSLTKQNRAAAVDNFINKAKNFLPGGKFSITGVLGNIFGGPKGPIDPYSGGKTGLHYEGPTTIDDNDRGDGQGIIPILSASVPITSAEDTSAVSPETGANLNRIAYRLMADGGAVIDDEPRQAYGLGSIVKKAARAVKKVAKSPIGKAAILAGVSFGIPGTQIGGLFGRASFGGAATGLFGQQGLGATLAAGKAKFFSQGLPNLAKGQIGVDKFGNAIYNRAGQSALGSLGLGTKAGLGIAALSALPLLGVGVEEDEETQAATSPYLTEGLDIAAIRANPRKFQGQAYRLMSEGGDTDDAKTEEKPDLSDDPNYKGWVKIYETNPDVAAMNDNHKQYLNFYERNKTKQAEGSKEPVAKKVMPLIDMDGMEKDYRETGGFVDIGRMEKADDVPARLSKNEFVFTADAVRNAGDGSVDKGAEVMYNMMKNLEAGGEVSEESQGLKGARKMFQTSQRLEEVL